MANRMILNKSILSRLSLIKYYFEKGCEQSYKSPPFCYFSILNFHDVVELFLILGAETLNAAVREKMSILDYWNVINQQMEDIKLSHKASFKKLNRARINFKHYGITPNKEEIESFRILTRNFFDENTPIIFSIEFDEISLIDLVQIDVVKEKLVEVQNLNKESKFRKSLIRLGETYRILISYKRFYSSISHYFTTGPSMAENKLEYIHEMLRFILLDIDFRKYVKFNLLTYVYVLNSIDSYVNKEEERICTKEQVNFCMNFIIECALKIQEFIDTYESIKF